MHFFFFFKFGFSVLSGEMLFKRRRPLFNNQAFQSYNIVMYMLLRKWNCKEIQRWVICFLPVYLWPCTIPYVKLLRVIHMNHLYWVIVSWYTQVLELGCLPTCRQKKCKHWSGVIYKCSEWIHMKTCIGYHVWPSPMTQERIGYID